MGIKFSNNASANIVQALTSTATSVSVTPGKGNLFPYLIEGDYFYATLAGNNGLEIVKVTNRVNDTMTIVRAQDNTTALAFDAGDLFELRIVAADFNDTISEVNDKLEDSLSEVSAALEAAMEETLSTVNSALSGKAPVSHASSSTKYGVGTITQYGHLKLSNMTDNDYGTNGGTAATPLAVKTAKEEAITSAGEALEAFAETQAAKDAAQDAAISTKISSVNGLTPDSDGNVDVGGMPLGTLFPYTGHDVPPGTLRADGSTYTNMRASFPDFYAWVVASGLTVPLAEYALVEGSCGFYGVNESTGTVRMPTLEAGVFGTTEAGQYGQAVQAGLPYIGGSIAGLVTDGGNASGDFRYQMTTLQDLMIGGGARQAGTVTLAPNNPIYGKTDTVTPSHVKYPWVIVVYNAAVPPSVAQAGEFIGLLDGKADKAQLDTVVAPGFVMPFAANSTPSGYLLCNGAAVSRATYAALFAAIGTTYGTGNGSSTFNLPNLADRFIQGSGTAGETKAAGLPEIYGVAGDGTSWNMLMNQEGAFYSTYVKEGEGGANYSSGGTRKNLLFSASKANAIYGNAGTVQPPAVTMRYYIKY